MKRYSVVSLFSGAGGLDLGFVQTGRYDIIFANEKRESAAKTYSTNIGLKLTKCDDDLAEPEKKAILVCDVERVNFDSMRDFSADILVGAPPCQDFSVIRGPGRRGIEVKRGRLYAYFVKALVALQPAVFLFENVPGLMNANNGFARKIILDDFRNLNIRWEEVKKVISNSNNGGKIEGYELVFAENVDFSCLGVPQRRKRFVIIGVRKDLISSKPRYLKYLKQKLRFLLTGKQWLLYKYALTAIEVFEGKPLDELDDKYKEIMKRWEGVWNEVGTDSARIWKMSEWDRLSLNIVEDYLTVNAINVEDFRELKEALEQHEAVLKELGYYGKPVDSLDPPDGTNELPRTSLLVLERMRRIPPGENYKFVKGTQWEVEGKDISLIYRRLHPLRPSYAVVAHGGGGTHGYHYDYARTALTLRERARLQTFPDEFRFYGKKTEIRSQIGEAVPPLAAKKIAYFLATEILDTVLDA